MPKPVVAAVQGAAAGFGSSLVVAADLALAAEDAIFTSGYIHLGTSPDGGIDGAAGAHRRAEACGRADAAGRPLRCTPRSAARARQPAGPAGRARSRSDGAASRLADGPTHAYGRTKALLQATLGDAFDAQLSRETESFAACAATEEFVEGVRAFLEKRRPKFSRIGVAVKKSRPPRWAAVIALTSAGLLSGCYYPYGYYPWGYPYPGPYAWGYPYPPPPPPPAPAGTPPTPLAPTQPAPPAFSAPVQRTPLPPQ